MSAVITQTVTDNTSHSHSDVSIPMIERSKVPHVDVPLTGASAHHPPRITGAKNTATAMIPAMPSHSTGPLREPLLVIASANQMTARLRKICTFGERHHQPGPVPHRQETADADADLIRAKGRGIAHTRPAFAYVFRRR
ncbi:hypothetical protein [Microbacterium hominis]|uniref:Uncharacterized protein n=1 Tax=Microbacterium hominis TaxID=162426 RepID=A0A7D4Q6C3_9MICO|nr:hypothetical protein [Microbacterium hominis]QKJ18059.1 hypothetical protein HQM25_00600 [Microbacterium hominis]